MPRACALHVDVRWPVAACHMAFPGHLLRRCMHDSVALTSALDDIFYI
jgi:hypothetical protein